MEAMQRCMAISILLWTFTQLSSCVNSERCSGNNRAWMNSRLLPCARRVSRKKNTGKLQQQYQVFWKGSHCPSKLTEKYLTPTESCRSLSKDTAQLATLRSRRRRQLCTLGRLALLLRLFSLMQSFNSVLFSSANKGNHTCQQSTIIYVLLLSTIIYIIYYTFTLQDCLFGLSRLLLKLAVVQTSKYPSPFLVRAPA